MIMKKLFTLCVLGLLTAAGLVDGRLWGQVPTSAASHPNSNEVSWADWQSDAARRDFWFQRGASVTHAQDAGAKGMATATVTYPTLAEAQLSVTPQAHQNIVCRLSDGTVVTFWSLARMETLWQRHLKSAQSRPGADGQAQPLIPASKKS